MFSLELRVEVYIVPLITELTGQQFNIGLTSKSVNSLAINSNDYIFAGTSGGGVFLSTDNGTNWTQINNGLNNGQGNLLTGILTQDWRWQQSLWVSPSLQVNYYDSNNNLILRIKGLRAPEQRHKMTYDSNNNLTEELWQDFSPAGWSNSTRWTHSYDTQNNKDSILTQAWDNGIWVNVGLDAFTYDINNNLIEAIYMEWCGSGFGTTWRDIYIQYQFLIFSGDLAGW